MAKTSTRVFDPETRYRGSGTKENSMLYGPRPQGMFLKEAMRSRSLALDDFWETAKLKPPAGAKGPRPEVWFSNVVSS